MTDEQLIEKAAKALTALTDAEWEIATAEGAEHLTGYFDAARRVLAVLEEARANELATSPERSNSGADSLHVEAHTPTNDEREALLAELSAWRAHTGDTALANLLGRAGNALRRSVVPEPSAEEWGVRAHAARKKAIAKGYTPDHDAEHGIRHLLNWALDYARRGRAEDSSGLILSALALLDAEPQAEPSDAQVEAAVEALWSDRGAITERMRAALRAAYAVTEHRPCRLPQSAPPCIGCECGAVTEQGENR